ncbi:MAG: PrsW family glutamic-type intramembrane protease [Chloroflexota bacterium]|nr:PrsW family glutamic-type intramembrane protease [Chloroflexota bacterium]
MQASYTADNELNRLERVAHNRRGLWFAVIIALAGLLAFVAVFNLVIPNFGAGLDGVPLIGLGLLFALVPAVLWLLLFYRLDRLEPEPKQMVFNVFLLGIFVTAALHAPILDGVFAVNEWLYANWWSQLLGNILVIGFVEQIIVWGIVRYTVFSHPEFDERVDGVIYAIAAGLGVATVLNFQYVLSRGGVDLSIGSIRMVVTSMAQASFAGVLGYFIGQARFERTPVYYMPLGLTVAATINGLFAFLLERTSAGALNSYPWTDLLLAAAVAAISMAVVFWLIARANEETLRLAQAQVPAYVPESPVAAPAAPSAEEANI